MNTQILKKTISVWLIFVPVAIINGTVRNLFYKPYVGDLTAHQISTVIGITAFVVLASLVFKNDLKSLTNKQLLSIGTIWVLMTILFEFVAGHYVFGNSWEKLFADYNLLNGRIWVLMLLTELSTPYLLKRFGKTK